MERRTRNIKAILLAVVFSLLTAFSVQAASSIKTDNLTAVEKMAYRRLKKLKAADKKSVKNLKKAFLWSAGMRFEDLNVNKKGKAAATYYGTYGFRKLRGDCNVEAYTFYWMAKVLGYDAKAVQGYVLKETGLGSHAWVTIKMGKKTYVFDPNFSKEYGTQLGRYCGFKLVYEQMKGRKHLQYYNLRKKALAK